MLLLASVTAQAQPVCPQPLRIIFLDKGMPPMLEGDGNAFAEPPGRFVEWARAAVRSLGCEDEEIRSLRQSGVVS